MKIIIKKVDSLGWGLSIKWEAESEDFSTNGEINIFYDKLPSRNLEECYKAIVKDALKQFKINKETKELESKLKAMEGKEIPDEMLLIGELEK